MAAIQWWPIKQKTVTGPWQVSGAVGYTYERKMVNDQKPDATQDTTMDMRIKKVAAGYVWKPWLVQWDSTTMVDVAKSYHDIWQTDSEEQEEDSDLLTRSMSTNFNLRVLPKSRFPFKLNISRQNDDSSSGTGTGKMNEKLGMQQEYTNRAKDLKLSLRFDHTRSRTGDRNKNDIFFSIPSFGTGASDSIHDSISIAANRTIKNHTFNMTTVASRAKDKDETSKSLNKNSSMTFTHNYTGSKTWGADTMLVVGADLGTNTSSEGITHNDTQNNQLSTSAYWRAESIPLSITGLGRIAHNSEGSKTYGASDKDESKEFVSNIDLSAIYSHSFTRKLSLNLAVSGLFEYDKDTARTEGSERTRSHATDASTSQSMQLSYRADRSRIGPFIYGWYTSGSASSTITAHASPSRAISEMIGHGITRRVQIGNRSDLLLNFTGSASGQHSTGTMALWTFNHNALGSLNWYYKGARALLNVTASDNRTFGATISDTQNLKIKLSTDGLLWGKTTWHGALSSEWKREATSDGEELSRSANASFRIERRNLFGITKLRFRSTFTMDIDGNLLPIGRYAGDIGESETWSWWNTVDYRIGKLIASLEAGMSESNGEDEEIEQEGLIKVEIKRYFDARF